jgi:hypothetical protein
MDIFFTRKYKYTAPDTIENVRAYIKSFTGIRSYDLIENITGRFQDGNKFQLWPKWSFGVIRWIETRPAYLNGKLSTDGDKTSIDITLRPNSGFVFFFYLSSILFLCEVFGISTFIQGDRIFKILFFPFFNLILFGLMQMFTIGLRRRFENRLHLQRDK